ncbi:MAG: hypothetical protein JGK24_15915 [Microcoleus sp. PH2017_29_MFU_D_A]|uniref:DUF6999 family protein n=1 Tax=unclassified Microcoleus TaxID=2642155 RepID=UPI001D907AC4|nr:MULTISPECIES: hypothetical protein [unclassified Microcoleus]MCC3433163.1 hypothetical protein [Microcoleus sp. PH2017_04_SCI_O_A]TAE12020.1 MAG: hypothetical protein EAZ94_14065 [Oscillatoriales cyanobacterium]MCC3426491.1 hypothetical protein [Microcoleus sp. PH2017_01_SCD_O_A]MCC3491504.1 hypothetical protein [Microcoleus sp. PH2017_16_JOR_D_A]MCC3535079.1 hypothetical protein [Microcoleus sp. PH2017_25_DOB_D_A]
MQKLQKQDIKTLPDEQKVPYATKPYNRRDPNVWDVLFCDRSIPVDLVAKAYMMRDLQNWTRNYLLIPIKIIANLLLAVIMIAKRLLPFQFRAYTLMHKSAAFFLNNFVSPEACYLIVRHISIGSNIINFLIDNGPDTEIEKSKLYPRTVSDLAENAFLEHDLILYNFVWDYNQAMLTNPNWLQLVQKRGINYDSIQPVTVAIDFERPRWLRILDLESAIELFKVFYSLCLTSDEFARAVMSLQLDENFGVYVSEITGNHDWNHVIVNRHPLAPNSPFNAARDLFLHGIISEYLYRYLELQKEMSIAEN